MKGNIIKKHNWWKDKSQRNQYELNREAEKIFTLCLGYIYLFPQCVKSAQNKYTAFICNIWTNKRHFRILATKSFMYIHNQKLVQIWMKFITQIFYVNA